MTKCAVFISVQGLGIQQVERDIETLCPEIREANVSLYRAALNQAKRGADCEDRWLSYMYKMDIPYYERMLELLGA